MKLSRQRFMSVVIAGVAGACVLALLFAIANARLTEPDATVQEFSAETTDRAWLESNAEIKFPPSATNAIGYVTGFREVETFVRFEADPTELQSFLDSTLCDNALEAVQAPAQPEFQVVSWWNLHEANELMYCSGGCSEFGQRVWVSMANPSLYVIFVFAWTT